MREPVFQLWKWVILNNFRHSDYTQLHLYNCKRHLYLTSLEHPIQLPHKQYSHSFFIAFRGGCCSISQRENQLHGKILLKTLILKNRVRLDKEFGSFFFYDSIFRSNPLAVDFLHRNRIFIFNTFRLMLLCPCRKAENKKWR